jgi:glycosyltransferase involved in cell wall biosynthesis
MPEPALIVLADDWGRHPSSCQHLIRHILPNRRVTWVNTIGTRPPALNWVTITRGFGKLKQWVGLARKSPPKAVGGFGAGTQPLVLNPKMWPSFRTRIGRGLNRRLLARALRPIAESGTPPIIITTLPLVADLVGRVRAARWLYYCVDDLTVWPSLDGKTMLRMEAELVAKVDVAVAVSETLQTHLTKLGKPSHLLTHGVDLGFWRSPVPSDTPLSLGVLAEISGPLVVFWGVIDRRMDVNFIRRLGEAMTGGTILLVGPQDNPDSELLRLPRVRTLPALPFADLPALAARTAVFIAPYADLPVTRAMQPLKLKEYIATGKPVVVRSLPATTPWADCADVVETPEAFASAVLARLRDGVPEEQRRARTRLEDESWAAKAAQFERWLDGH